MGYYWHRKIKSNFLRFKLHKLIPFRGPLKNLLYLADFSEWVEKHNKDLVFSDFFTPKWNYGTRENLFLEVGRKENLFDQPIDYLEFGVSKATSFKWWLTHQKMEKSRFFGFDTFEGLPEDWGGYKKGAMSAKVPHFEDNRHQFVVGLFQDTVPSFLESYQRSGRLVLHLDADLYTATYYVLNKFEHLLQPGDIIFFDEFGVPLHEYKAMVEFFSSYYRKYQVLGSANNFFQLAIKVL